MLINQQININTVENIGLRALSNLDVLNRIRLDVDLARISIVDFGYLFIRSYSDENPLYPVLLSDVLYKRSESVYF